MRTLRHAAKRLAAPFIGLRPYPSLQPSRLYLWLDVLARCAALPGDVVEVGCFEGGTSALAFVFLKEIGHPKRYLALDTFGGFVPAQFDADVARGTRASLRRMFGRNSMAYVRWMLDRWYCRELELVAADIATAPDAVLPERVAAGLVDVDLEQPTLAALERLLPRLSPGGILLVDDCDEGNPFAGARIAYHDFVRAHGIPERYQHGMGVVAPA